MKFEKFTCCICGKEITNEFGNNPWGAVVLDKATNQYVFGKFKDTDKCCNECNINSVIPGRICQLQLKK